MGASELKERMKQVKQNVQRPMKIKPLTKKRPAEQKDLVLYKG